MKTSLTHSLSLSLLLSVALLCPPLSSFSLPLPLPLHRQSSPACPSSTCVFSLCRPRPLPLTPGAANTAATSAICLSGRAIGVANSGPAFTLPSRSSVSTTLGLSPSFFKTVSLPNTSASIAFETLPTTIPSASCFALPITTAQIFDPTGAVSNVHYGTSRPFVNCVAFSTQNIRQPATINAPIDAGTGPGPDADGVVRDLSFVTDAGVSLRAAAVIVHGTGGMMYAASNDSVDAGGDVTGSSLRLEWVDESSNKDVSIVLHFNIENSSWYISRVVASLTGLPSITHTLPPASTLTPFGSTFSGDIVTMSASLLAVQLAVPRPTCGGADAGTDLVLRKAGDVLISGVYYTNSALSTGSAFIVAVLDATDCSVMSAERVRAQDVIFRGFVMHEDIVSVEELVLEEEATTKSAQIYVSISFNKPGATTLVVRALRKGSLDQLARLSIPVVVEAS